MTGIDLSILIVNWNTVDLLSACLASLPAACGTLDYEVLVVDNNSCDGSADRVRRDFPDCRLIESGGNLGFSKANNIALAQARGQRLLMLNPDTVCPEASLQRLCLALDAHPKAAAVGPTLLDEQNLPTASYGNFPNLWRHLASIIDPADVWIGRPWRNHGLGSIPKPGQPASKVDYVKGACLLMNRAAFQEIGPLDEQFFMYFEETDWCYRARQAGWEIWLHPEIAISHLEGQAAGKVSDFSRRQFQHSYRLYLAKYYGPSRVLFFRTAQALEYGVKSLLHKLHPGEDHQALARHFWATAQLQFQRTIAPQPPQ